MSLVNTSNFAKLIQIITEIASDLNRNHALRVPIQKPKHSDLDRFKDSQSIAILIGEQHQGARFKNINFSQSNRSITELVLRLFNNEELKLKSTFKEGLSELKPHPELEKLSKEDFLRHQVSPLVTLIHLIEKNGQKLKVVSCESPSLFIEFALLSLLHTSLPGVSEMPEQELERIKNLLNYHDTNSEITELIDKLSKKIDTDFQLANLKEQKLLKEIKFNSVQFYEFNHRQTANQEIINLGYLLNSALKNKLLARDEYISEQILKAGTGIHSILIGELHIENLRKLLEAHNIAVISISTFV